MHDSDEDEPEWLRRASDTLATAAPAAKPGRNAAPAEDDEFDEAAIRKAAAKHAASLLRRFVLQLGSGVNLQFTAQVS